MINKTKNKFRPDYAVPPGEILLETITAMGMSQADLSVRTSMHHKAINEIIMGKAAITPEISNHLERVLGMPASFWTNLERNCQEAKEW
jgi:HTH-type transcriptional regulator / antitoxin HigA